MLRPKGCSAQAPNLENNCGKKIFSLVKTDILEYHQDRAEGPISDASGQPGLCRGLMKLSTPIAQQGQHSHITTAFMFFPLKQTKLLSEFATEGKFGSWLFSTGTGRADPKEPFAQAELEQQQAVYPFLAWGAAMEAEELWVSSLQVHSWERPWLSSHILLLLPSLPLCRNPVLTSDR